MAGNRPRTEVTNGMPLCQKANDIMREGEKRSIERKAEL